MMMIPAILCGVLLVGQDASVELKTETGLIHGTLSVPAGDGPWPVVIVHAGSGPTDRDGNNPQMKNNSLKMLGDALVAKNYAVLRYDKRGIAGSAKAGLEEKKLSIDLYAADLNGWVSQLRKDKRFSAVHFIGHSEGALIGSIAAKETPFDKFVSLCGAGRPFDVVVCEQIGRDSKDLAAASETIFKAIEKGEEPKDIPKVLVPLFRESVRPYLKSILNHDPAKRFGELQCPALIVTGTTDIQITDDDAKGLAKANPKAKTVRIENMMHILKEHSDTNKLLQLAIYNSPDKPLHPNLLPSLIDFLSPAGAP